MKFASFAVASVLAALSSASAFANPCTGSFASTFENARAARKAEVFNAWQDRGRDCSFQTDIESIFGFFSESGPLIRSCKNKGINAGTYEALGQIGDTCARQGKRHGRIDGNAHGAGYCAPQFLASRIEVQGDYEINYETNCKNAFINYVNANCSDKRASDWNFNATVENKCNI